jgi:hypothetical protein
MREGPHLAKEPTTQFSHGITSHIHDGIQSQLDPIEYLKDEVTCLMHHKLSGLSQDEFQHMVLVTRRYAEGVVAYDLQQITEYEGVEPHMNIEFGTEHAIHQPPRRIYSQEELRILDEKTDELLAAVVVHEVKYIKYACNPMLAAKRAPDGTWSDKRFVSISSPLINTPLLTVMVAIELRSSSRR